MFYRILLSVSICAFFFQAGLSQFTTNPEEDFTAGRGENTEVTDTVTERSSFLDIFTGKPGKAAFYSLIIPGGGQYYNRRYWKIPFVYALEGGAIYWLLWNNSRFNTWQDAYLGLLNDEISDYRGITDPSRARTFRDAYRQNKEYAYLVVILAHLINVFDAFIDRHLLDFDIDDDLSFRNIDPSNAWTMPTFGNISIRIPLQRKPREPVIINPLLEGTN